jgi:hypothetical protein
MTSVSTVLQPEFTTVSDAIDNTSLPCIERDESQVGSISIEADSAELSSSEENNFLKMPDNKNNQDDGSAASYAIKDTFLNSSPYNALAYRALNNSRHRMAINLIRVAKALMELDPSFDHRKFGFKKFVDFCNSLQPEYVTLKDGQDRIYIQHKNRNLSGSNADGLANRPAYMDLVDRVFETRNNGRFVEVRDLLEAMTELDPLFDYHALGFPTVHAFSRALQPNKELIVIGDLIYMSTGHTILKAAQVTKEMSTDHVTVQPSVDSSESDSSSDLASLEEKGLSV